MAEVIKTVIGFLSGALGNMVFKERLGKHSVSMRPHSFTAGTDEKAVKRRTRFGLTGQFAAAVNINQYLKRFWDIATPPTMTPINGIFRYNYKHISDSDVSNTVSLVPTVGFSVSEVSIALTRTHCTVVLNPIGNLADINPSIEQFVQMAVVIHCSNPVDPKFELHHFIPLKSGNVNLSLSTEMTFDIPLNDYQTQYFDRYTDHKGFFAFVTLDTDQKGIRYSNTLQ
jgi:hypothetical protein